MAKAKKQVIEWMSSRGKGSRVVVLDSGLMPGVQYLRPCEVRCYIRVGPTPDPDP